LDRAPIRREIIKPLSNVATETHSLQVLGLLLRGTLHEIANPLVALVGSAELALAETEPGTKLHERIALTRRTGTEIAGIVRALQAFIRLQEAPAGPLSLGQAATEAVSLVDLVLPTHDVTMTATGDATVFAAPGEVGCSLVELIVGALEHTDARGAIALTVRSEGSDAIVAATGGGELRLPAAVGAT
jgi:signal transduction histidine kinase